jgi:hypothetical protein
MGFMDAFHRRLARAFSGKQRDFETALSSSDRWLLGHTHGHRIRFNSFNRDIAYF